MATRSTSAMEELKRELVLSAEEDYTDLASYVHEVSDALGIRSKDRAREVTLRLVAELLEEGLIRPGMPTADGGFDSWDEDLVESVARIDSAWRHRGRSPELGEIVWFEATEKGEDYAGRELASR